MFGTSESIERKKNREDWISLSLLEGIISSGTLLLQASEGYEGTEGGYVHPKFSLHVIPQKGFPIVTAT